MASQERAMLESFGEVLDICKVGDSRDRGYISFGSHSAAALCVASGVGRWSESERILASSRNTQSCAYSIDVVSAIRGPGGRRLKDLMDSVNARKLQLGGVSLEHDVVVSIDDYERRRRQHLHFVCG